MDGLYYENPNKGFAKGFSRGVFTIAAVIFTIFLLCKGIWSLSDHLTNGKYNDVCAGILRYQEMSFSKIKYGGLTNIEREKSEAGHVHVFLVKNLVPTKPEHGEPLKRARVYVEIDEWTNMGGIWYRWYRGHEDARR